MNRLLLSITILFLVSACCTPLAFLTPATPTPQPTETATASPPPPPPPPPSATLKPTHTSTPAPSRTPTRTATPPATATPTITETPTITPTPTFDFPDVTVHTQAHCRYGPSTAFLHAADLYPGDQGVVHGRYLHSAWLYVKFDKLAYWCWVSPSVVDVVGDLNRVVYQPLRLPEAAPLYNPPAWVRAVRQGDQVTITWAAVPMTEDDDRGYLLDVFVCQNTIYMWYPVSLPNDLSTSYTFTDQAGCANKSGGVLYAVEKHGYIVPSLTINWPAP